MRKFLRKMFKVIGISFLAGLVVLLVLNIIWSRQVKAEIAKIKAKGEPTSMADLAKPAIPDSQNAALIYIEIGKRLSTDDARKDMHTLREFTSRQSREKNPRLWDESRAIIGKYKDVVALTESAEAKPRCRFPADWSKGATEATPWRHYSKLRSLARLLHANALLSAKDGRMEECCRLLNLSFKLTNALKEEPSLIAYLSRIVLLMTASRGLQDSLQYGLFDEHQSKQLFDTLRGVDLEEGYRRMLLGERVLFLRDLPQVRGAEMIETSRVQDFTGLVEMLSGNHGRAMRHVTDLILGAAYDLACRNGDRLVWLRFMDRQMKGVRLSYKDAESKGILKDPHLPFFAVMSNMAGPVEARMTRSRFRTMAISAGDQTELALLSYKDRYGAYPNDLAELQAKLGYELPTDVYSGGSLIYKRQGKGFILYSVGPDLKDDGGNGPARPDLIEDKGGDMVWRMDR